MTSAKKQGYKLMSAKKHACFANLGTQTPALQQTLFYHAWSADELPTLACTLQVPHHM